MGLGPEQVSVAFRGRKHRSNAPKAKALAVRTQVDGADFGVVERAGTALGLPETRRSPVARIARATKQVALAVRSAERLRVAKVCRDRLHNRGGARVVQTYVPVVPVES